MRSGAIRFFQRTTDENPLAYHILGHTTSEAGLVAAPQPPPNLIFSGYPTTT